MNNQNKIDALENTHMLDYMLTDLIIFKALNYGSSAWQWSKWIRSRD